MLHKNTLKATLRKCFQDVIRASDYITFFIKHSNDFK